MRAIATTLAMFAFGAAPASALEIQPLPGRTGEGGQAQFAVIFEAGDPETVRLVTAAGTAQPDEDFEPQQFDLVKTPHPPPQYNEIWVDTVMDDRAEQDETFSLQTVDGAVSGTATIQERDDTNVYASTRGYEQPVEEQGTLSVPITVQSEEPVTVDFRTVDGLATDGRDYRATGGRLTFPAGTTERNVAIEIIDNQIDERYGKWFYLLVTGDDIYDTVVRIQIDDREYSRAIVEPARVREGDTPVTASMTVRLSLPTSSTITVPLWPELWWMESGPRGSDVVHRTTHVAFPAGSTVGTAEFEVVGDDVVEGPESFFIRHPYGIAYEQVDGGLLTIEDDDTADVATAGDQPLLALGHPTLQGRRTVAIGARCLAARGRCTGRLTLSSRGDSRRKPLALLARRVRTLRFRLPRATAHARRVRVRAAAVVRDARGRSGRATATALLRR